MSHGPNEFRSLLKTHVLGLLLGCLAATGCDATNTTSESSDVDEGKVVKTTDVKDDVEAEERDLTPASDAVIPSDANDASADFATDTMADLEVDFPDSDTLQPADSVQVDASKPDHVSFANDVQPLLRKKCGTCHSMQSPNMIGDHLFVDDYEEVQRPSTLCEGYVVGECIRLAVENQEVEGTGCRTYVVSPFHRESWACLTDAERMLINRWVDEGMAE